MSMFMFIGGEEAPDKILFANGAETLVASAAITDDIEDGCNITPWIHKDSIITDHLIFI